MDKNERDSIIEIWKTVVEVQQHFNDIEMKIRGFFIAIVVAIVAAQGFLLEKRLSFSLGSVTILYATFLPLVGVVVAYLFYFMDRYWYHRLLIGAVLHAGTIEKKYESELPELSLGAKISERSPVELRVGWPEKWPTWWCRTTNTRKTRYFTQTPKSNCFTNRLCSSFF